MNISYNNEFIVGKKKIKIPSDYLHIELYDIKDLNRIIHYFVSDMGNDFSSLARIKDFYDDLINYKESLSEFDTELFENKNHHVITKIFSELLVKDINEKSINKILSLSNYTGGLQFYIYPKKEQSDFYKYIFSDLFKDYYEAFNNFLNIKLSINLLLVDIDETAIDIILPVNSLLKFQDVISKYINKNFRKR